MCQVAVAQYDGMREFRDKLRAKPGFKWLEQEYELPESLEKWLGDDYTNLIANRTYDGRLLTRKDDVDFFKLSKSEYCEALARMKGEDVDEAPDEMDIDDSIENNQELELEDVTPIPRNFANSKPSLTIDHSFSSLKSKDSIKTFIETETLYRKVNRLKSLTISKMKKKAWKDFKDDIKNKIVLMQENPFVDYVQDFLAQYSNWFQ